MFGWFAMNCPCWLSMSVVYKNGLSILSLLHIVVLEPISHFVIRTHTASNVSFYLLWWSSNHSRRFVWSLMYRQHVVKSFLKVGLLVQKHRDYSRWYCFPREKMGYLLFLYDNHVPTKENSWHKFAHNDQSTCVAIMLRRRQLVCNYQRLPHTLETKASITYSCQYTCDVEYNRFCTPTCPYLLMAELRKETLFIPQIRGVSSTENMFWFLWARWIFPNTRQKNLALDLTTNRRSSIFLKSHPRLPTLHSPHSFSLFQQTTFSHTLTLSCNPTIWGPNKCS